MFCSCSLFMGAVPSRRDLERGILVGCTPLSCTIVCRKIFPPPITCARYNVHLKYVALRSLKLVRLPSLELSEPPAYLFLRVFFRARATALDRRVLSRHQPFDRLFGASPFLFLPTRSAVLFFACPEQFQCFYDVFFGLVPLFQHPCFRFS